MLHRHRKVKIIATLGPKSASLEIIRSFAEKGVNLFRINMSHGEHETHAHVISCIRSIERDLGYPLGILVDLQGPKLRIGSFQDSKGITLEKGDSFSLDLSPEGGTNNRVSFPHPEIYPHITKGDIILLNDGALKFEVTAATSEKITCAVLVGGALTNKKGVNLPKTSLPLASLTPKDKKDLQFALAQGADYIGLSFVQSPEDVQALKTLVGDRAAILSKIEKPQALEHLDQIVALSDGIMVARGDLGVEISPERVPSLQKKIIRSCKTHGKPVIVATQMLETMTQNPFPTRAEASDVATAVYDGADAVMLSAESAVGNHPLASIEMMDRIISSVEADDLYLSFLEKVETQPGHVIADALSAATCQLSYTLPASAIVTYTATGDTARQVSHKRPHCMILGLTDSQKTARQLTLVWGVYPDLIDGIHTFEEMTQEAIQRVKSKGGEPGDQLIFTCGIPFGNPGSTNIINVQTIS